jgi:hypothetical protein
MNLYIYEGHPVLLNYSTGMVVVAASSEDEAREMCVKHFAYEYDIEPDTAMIEQIKKWPFPRSYALGEFCAPGIKHYVRGGD